MLPPPDEGRLARVATELAQRGVEVSCPGFFARLVEITPYGGWVHFDEHGRPALSRRLRPGARILHSCPSRRRSVPRPGRS
ncbi:MAG: hypothetical protein H0T61_11680 [Actinobacteria bacterium]|nr:hypothetical protein [Actinomycetota bacterium]